MTRRPLEVDGELLAGLRAAGLGDEAIREAANVGFHFNFINRVADAFDFPLPSPEQKRRQARMLDRAARLFKGRRAETPWERSADDGVFRPTEVERGRQRMLRSPGETSGELRRAVDAFVARQWGVTRDGAGELPAELAPYCKKLSLHAYKIVDEDVDALRAAGYSKDAIYEVTVVGAIGAALIGLEQLFETMYGSERGGPADAGLRPTMANR